LPLTDGRLPRRSTDTDHHNIAGLHERVTVRRDERGIPYIEAANNDDLYFAQAISPRAIVLADGFAGRNVRGELAEIFGEGALGEDKRHRTFGFAQVVDETANTYRLISRRDECVCEWSECLY